MTQQIYIVRQNDVIIKAFNTKRDALISMKAYAAKWKEKYPDNGEGGFNLIETTFYEK